VLVVPRDACAYVLVRMDFRVGGTRDSVFWWHEGRSSRGDEEVIGGTRDALPEVMRR